VLGDAQKTPRRDERCLFQETVGRLLREVGDKSREVILAPTPDKGDRG
jgi:hypothetical protein